MGNIIDASFFIGDLNIPNATTTNANVVTWYINKYEPEYLQFALGYTLMKLFVAGLTADNPDQRWKDLRDGAEYTNGDGKVRKWQGLKTANKQSAIANYVFYWYTRKNSTTTTPFGESQGQVENAKIVSAADKQSKVYNEMADITDQMVDFLINAKTGDVATYPEFDKDDTEPFGKLTYFI